MKTFQIMETINNNNSDNTNDNNKKKCYHSRI